MKGGGQESLICMEYVSFAECLNVNSMLAKLVVCKKEANADGFTII